MSERGRRRWPFGQRGDSDPAEQAAAASGRSSGAAAEELGAALDLIARLVRLVGEVPVLPDEPAAGELRAVGEGWARHILTLAPPPGSETATPQRGWGPLAHYLTERRHREQEQVAAGFADLRRAVLNIAEAVRGSLASEQPDSQLVDGIVGRLEAACDVGSLEQLRQHVRQAADELRVLSTQRDSRQRELAEHVNTLSVQMQDLAAELHQARQASETDALTGLLNRAGFDTAVRRALVHHATTGQKLSLALIDLDDLKWVNDHHGHGVGDLALRAVADSLRTACRSADALARIGGDEFAAILTDVNVEQSERVAERVLHELWSRNLAIEDGVIHVSASIGIADVRVTDGPRSWMDRADKRLYQAKGRGKNRVFGEPTTEKDG